MSRYNNHNHNHNCHERTSKEQKQVLIDKQLLKQKLDEEYTADMLGRALSKAEYLSSRFGKNSFANKNFDYYNRFDNGISKDKNKLIKSFINAIDTLQDYYEMDGPNRKFPSNLNQTKIIKYIEKMRDNLKQEEELIFDLFNDFIHIIKGDQVVNFEDYFNSKEASVDPNILVSSGIDTMKISTKQEAEWKKKVEEKGNYDVELKIGKNWTDNPHFSKYMKMDDLYDSWI